MSNTYVYIAIMALVAFATRALPLTLVRREIKSAFLRSFLHYVPYVTLAAMTFPAMLGSTRSPYSALAALGTGILLSWKGASLFTVAVACCAAVFLLELAII